MTHTVVLALGLAALGAWCWAETIQPASEQTPRLGEWERLKYGMFIHFGMSTFTGEEIDPGTAPSATYAPTNLDVRQWVRVAKEAGMKYIVLTAKHVSGHCLWDSENYDYDVATGGNTSDVVAEFMAACKAEGIKPGLYYCTLDGHNEGGVKWKEAVTEDYFKLMKRQLTELHTRYPGIYEQWIDIPQKMSAEQRWELYRLIKGLSPDCIVMMNQGFKDGAQVPQEAWPTDLLNGERTLPVAPKHYAVKQVDGALHYLPMEVCDTIAKNWFWLANDPPKPVEELHRLYDTCMERGANLLLDVPPDKTGRIPEEHVKALTELKKLIDGPSSAQKDENTDAKYIERFEKSHKKVEPPPVFDAYATVARYDASSMGEKLKKGLDNVSNDQGALAWGLSYQMMSLNDMYRVTRDAKYLSANLEYVRAVIASRDDKRGVKLWTGVVAPAWGCDKYAERGRAIFAVHTGMILYPILDFLLLAKQDAAFLQTLGNEFETMVTASNETLAYHDRQWRDGPTPGEGHYIGMDQELVCDGKPLPGNRLSSIGRALWVSWKVTGNTTHRDRALALGRYIKNRLTPGPDDAYYWPYWLPLAPVAQPAPKDSIHGEDTSHAGLTIALPLELAADGQVFTGEDMKRLANTVLKGFGRLPNGVMFGDITGNPASNPEYVQGPAAWLPLAKHAPEVRGPILSFYLNYRASPSPCELALLLGYGKN